MKPTYEQLEKKVRNHRIAWALAFLIAIADVIAWYDMNEEVVEYKYELLQKQSEAQQLNEAVQFIYNVDTMGYIRANEALFLYCDPIGRTKAINATPLPKLVQSNG